MRVGKRSMGVENKSRRQLQVLRNYDKEVKKSFRVEQKLGEHPLFWNDLIHDLVYNRKNQCSGIFEYQLRKPVSPAELLGCCTRLRIRAFILPACGSFSGWELRDLREAELGNLEVGSCQVIHESFQTAGHPPKTHRRIIAEFHFLGYVFPENYCRLNHKYEPVAVTTAYTRANPETSANWPHAARNPAPVRNHGNGRHSASRRFPVPPPP